MKETALIEAYRTKAVNIGDLLLIKTDEGTKEFLYLCYSDTNSMHWLFPYPPSVDSLKRRSPVFYSEDDIIEWKKIWHQTPEELVEELKKREAYASHNIR
jgi:hypothetical protein